MPICHHADPASLMSYSSGTLGEALSAVVAGHVAMCPHCRSELARMDDIGGAIVASLPASAMMSMPPAPRAANAATAAKPSGETSPLAKRPVPAPLVRLAGPDLDAVPWKRLALGVWHHRLPLSAGAEGDLRLIKIAPGQVMPEHGHGGSEMTLVLDGCYTDALGRFKSGDLADLDDQVEHQPIAGHESGCICLIASEKRARFKGLLARIAQPFVGL